jgi:diguanylate cyclase (GGDEF)-like protein/putative nucleotidyltransferase with HDIG domain
MKKLLADLKRYNPKSLLTLVSLTLAAVSLIGFSLYKVFFFTDKKSGVIFITLAVLLAFASSQQVIRFPGTHSGVTLTETLIFLAIIALTPYHAVVLAAIEVSLASRRLQVKPGIVLFNISNITLSCFLAGKVFLFVRDAMPQLLSPQSKGEEMLLMAPALVVMAATHYFFHIALLSLMIQFRHGTKITETVADTFPWEPITSVVGATAAGALYFAFHPFNPVKGFIALLLLVPVPILIYYSFKAYGDNLTAKQHHYQEVSNLYDSILEMLAMAIDAKDDVTHDHIQRVKLFARRMGELVGLSETEIEALKAGALLHDVGKIGVPAYILNKPGKLTEHEFEQMKMHTIIGADMLSNIDFRYPVVPIVRHHHERWDGRGYPDGLKGDEIPITARILTLVDTYDALSSDRPYHQAMTRESALAFVKQNAGSMYDPKLVEVFLQAINELEREAAELLAMQAEKRQREHEITVAMAEARPGNGLAEAPPTDRATRALHSIAEINQGVAALYEMSRTLSSILSVDDTIAILGNRLTKLLPFTTCAIALFNANRSEFEIVLASGRHAEKMQRKRQPAETGITGWVITNQKPMYNTNPILDLGFLSVEESREYKGVMVFPLTKNGDSLGAIAIYSTEIETYSSQYIQLMEKVSQAASDAVYNAIAFEQAQKAANTDAVTGLVNTRGIAAHFEREKARSQRNNEPLSLLLISINQGAEGAEEVAIPDQTLAAVGQVIKQQINGREIAARYWNHSFIVLLPDAGNMEVATKRSNLQRAIEATRTVPAGVTIGLATMPNDGDSFEDLLQTAHLDCITSRASFDLFAGRVNSLIKTGGLQ